MPDTSSHTISFRHNPPLVLITCLVLAVLLGAAGFGTLAYLNRDRLSNPFPERIVQSAKGSLYYPQRLPEGFSLNADSIKVVEDEVVTFMIDGPEGKIIHLSEQPKPKDFDFDMFYSKFLNVTREVSLPVGLAKIGTTKDRPGKLMVSLVAEPTWLLVTYPDTIKREDIDAILRSFKQAH